MEIVWTWGILLNNNLRRAMRAIIFPEYRREVSQQFRIVDIHGVVAARG